MDPRSFTFPWPIRGRRCISLTAKEKQVEMEFYIPIAQNLRAGTLDALIRQYDPLSAGCPPLDFREVRGMLKGLSTWYSATALLPVGL
jgi:hypothetical protein